MLTTYAHFIELVSKVLLGLGIAAGAICVVDWAIRARHINPFSHVARFFRRYIDPLLQPIETMVVRRGGQPAQAPFYAFMAVVVGGIILLQVLRLLGGLIAQVAVGITSPQHFILLLLSWALQFLIIALIVRVVSSWLPVSPYSKWIRWSFASTEWILAPLRRVIPSFSGIDFTPLVAYFILIVVRGILGLR